MPTPKGLHVSRPSPSSQIRDDWVAEQQEQRRESFRPTPKGLHVGRPSPSSRIRDDWIAEQRELRREQLREGRRERKNKTEKTTRMTRAPLPIEEPVINPYFVVMPEPIREYTGMPNTTYHPAYPPRQAPRHYVPQHRVPINPEYAPSTYAPEVEYTPWEESLRILLGQWLPPESPSGVTGVRG